MLLPEDFRDRAARCLNLAELPLRPKIKKTLIERAKVLTQLAVQAERNCDQSASSQIAKRQ